MEEIFSTLLNALLEYGAIGLLAAIGWGLAGWFLFRDFKKRDAVSAELTAKDAIIKSKDDEVSDTKDKLADTIKELSDKRLEDLKEVTEDYKKVATDVIHTLDRLMMALEVRSQAGRD